MEHNEALIQVKVTEIDKGNGNAQVTIQGTGKLVIQGLNSLFETLSKTDEGQMILLGLVANLK